jgi:hypothetical protein
MHKNASTMDDFALTNLRDELVLLRRMPKHAKRAVRKNMRTKAYVSKTLKP